VLVIANFDLSHLKSCLKLFGYVSEIGNASIGGGGGGGGGGGSLPT
jgi:hypothetical protein